MMDCRSARDLLLEAEPAELRGEGGSPLAAHLRECAGCRSAARAILAGQAELDAALRALAAAPAEARVLPLRRRAGLARRVATLAVPLAAAAAAVMLLDRGPAPENPGITRERIARALFPRRPVARPISGRNATVLRTSDPGVTLVWIY